MSHRGLPSVVIHLADQFTHRGRASFNPNSTERSGIRIQERDGVTCLHQLGLTHSNAKFSHFSSYLPSSLSAHCSSTVVRSSLSFMILIPSVKLFKQSTPCLPQSRRLAINTTLLYQLTLPAEGRSTPSMSPRRQL